MKDSKKSLFDPGNARVFFSEGFDSGLPKRNKAFCAKMALWLAELSRLSYRRSDCVNPSRIEILSNVGLREIQVFQTTSLFASIVCPIESEDFGFLVFRGTQELDNWLTNMQFVLCQWSGAMMVHEGFKQALDSLEPQLSQVLCSLKIPLYYTGHSLGGALATLAASRFSPHALYTFGAPRVGNLAFNESLAGLPWFRVCNARDVVCNVPPPLPIVGFSHGGVPVYITQAGNLKVGVNSWFIAVDQWQLEWLAKSKEDMKELMDLPSFLSDHAPINYVQQLQRIAQNS